MKNVHHNASTWVPPTYQRLTHKQQIAIQTFSDMWRHGIFRTPPQWYALLDHCARCDRPTRLSIE